MKQSKCSRVLSIFILLTIFSFFSCNSGWANPQTENSSEMKILINEVRQLRNDVRRYNMLNFKLLESFVGLQMQVVKLNKVNEDFTAITAEIEDLNSQNSADKEEVAKLTEQASSFNQETTEKYALLMQISTVNQIISDREKFIDELKEKEVLKENELNEEKKVLDSILSKITQLGTELNGR